MQTNRQSSAASSARALSRRRFLTSSSMILAAAPFAMPGRLRAGGANSKLSHACIGVAGMMGGNDLKAFQSHPKVQIVALCDVDENHLQQAAQQVPGARLYRDWREMLAAEGDKVDAINATVPDHMHYPIAHKAVQLGKHVYCQKPLCHDVAEARSLAQAAIKMGVRSQLGTQKASGIGDLTTVKLIQQGAIGKIKHAYLCSNRPNAIDNYRLVGPRPSQVQPPPTSLNWDLWLGNAAERPFCPGIYHPIKWRAWQDFGTGWAGDIGCHIFDAVWKALDLKAPVSVVAEVQETWKNSRERRVDTWPQSDDITWVFPGGPITDGKEIVIEWFDGLMYPPDNIRRLYSEDFKEYPAESAMVVGTEGALLLQYGRNAILLPEEKFKNYKRPEVPKRDHYHHFVDACLGGEKTESHFGQTGPMAEAILLGTVAIRVPDQKLVWDSVNLKFPNYPEAEKFLRRTYRPGWEV